MNKINEFPILVSILAFGAMVRAGGFVPSAGEMCGPRQSKLPDTKGFQHNNNNVRDIMPVQPHRSFYIV